MARVMFVFAHCVAGRLVVPGGAVGQTALRCG